MLKVMENASLSCAQDTSPTRYYLALSLVPGLGTVGQHRLIEICGSAEAAWLRAGLSEATAAGLSKKAIAALFSARETLDLDAELARVAQVGASLLTREDPTYPRLLAHIPYPPLLLYVRGAFSSADDRAIAVVGTRSPTSYGKEVTRHIVKELVDHGFTIVSGLAVGVDTIAHTTALEMGGRTIGVFGCGIDIIYPERNADLVRSILEHQQGTVVSEYPVGTPPYANNFPPRNRIISGLALGTIVTEAGERSGALITTEFALEQGREVFAVPGSIFNRTSKGVHQLIRNGAALVECAADVLEALNLDIVGVQQELAQALPEDPIETAVIQHLSSEPQHVDVLCRNSGIPIATISATLAMLELKGFVRQVGPMEYVRKW